MAKIEPVKQSTRIRWAEILASYWATRKKEEERIPAARHLINNKMICYMVAEEFRLDPDYISNVIRWSLQNKGIMRMAEELKTEK